MARKIYQECFAETYLVNLLGYNKPSHCRGTGRVFKQLEKNANVPTIGIVDGDASMPKEFKKYTKTQSSSDGNLEIFQNKQNNSILIVHKPDFETWIFDIAKKKRLLKKDGKINSVQDLKAITKQNVTRINRNKEFAELMHDINSLEDSPFEIVKNSIEKDKL